MGTGTLSFSEVMNGTPWQVTQGIIQKNPVTAVKIEVWINRHNKDAVEKRRIGLMLPVSRKWRRQKYTD